MSRRVVIEVNEKRSGVGEEGGGGGGFFSPVSLGRGMSFPVLPFLQAVDSRMRSRPLDDTPVQPKSPGAEVESLQHQGVHQAAGPNQSTPEFIDHKTSMTTH